MLKKFLIVLLVFLIGLAGYILGTKRSDTSIQVSPTPRITSAEISSFEECIDAGNPVMESYPRQCNAGGKNFTEDVSYLEEKADLIVIESPQPYETISCPFEISGKARGNWYFEAQFPIKLCEGRLFQVCSGELVATAEGEWMTTDFVPFNARLENCSGWKGRKGVLYFKKANASGLPEHDDQLGIPLSFK